MAQEPSSTPLDFYHWGSATHTQCVLAVDPCDAYLKLYKRQYRRCLRHRLSLMHDFFDRDDDIKKDKDGIVTYPKHVDFRLKTMKVVNWMLNDIFFDESVWSKHYRYKHKNKAYLEKSAHETFKMWYARMMANELRQLPQRHARNKIVLVPITDDVTYFMDDALMTTLKQLVRVFFGLSTKDIDVHHGGDNDDDREETEEAAKAAADNIIFAKDEHGTNFITHDIHGKLSAHYERDADIFCSIGVCFKIGLFSTDEQKVVHGDDNPGGDTQSAVVSFAKLGVYNKLDRNIPEWLKIRRCGKILLHFIARQFGMRTCEYFRCLMNKDVVLDCVPMTLCPVCLNKLYFSLVYHNTRRNTFESDIACNAHSLQSHSHSECKTNDCDVDEEKERESDRERKRNLKVKHATNAKKKKLKIDATTFNLYDRFQGLADFFYDHKLYREATWYKNRLTALNVARGLKTTHLDNSNHATDID